MIAAHSATEDEMGGKDWSKQYKKDPQHPQHREITKEFFNCFGESESDCHQHIPHYNA